MVIEYQVQICDAYGDKKAEIDASELTSGTLDQSINNPAVVSLNFPITPKITKVLTSIERPNDVRVYRDGTHVFSGPIALNKTRHKSLKSIQLDALDYMSNLKTEYVTLYDASDTCTNHCDDILAQQVSTTAVMLGTIEPTVTRDVTIRENYIYQGLMSLRSCVGGYMTVDADRKLNWYNQLSDSTGQQIRYKKNLIGIEKSVDWMNLGNKLYIYGYSSVYHTPVVLTDAGYATDYILDQDSIDTYGLFTRKILAEDFETAATMLEYAYLKIKEMCQPRVTYTVDIANLANFGYDFDSLSLGSWVTLIDPEININVDVQIVRVIYDIVRPEKIKIELAAKSIDVTNLLSTGYVYER